MALIFVPTVGSFVGRPGSTDPQVLAVLAAGEHGDLNSIGGATGRYIRMLSAIVPPKSTGICGTSAICSRSDVSE